MGAPQDITGQRYGRLLVVRQFRQDRRTMCECKCDCGNSKIVWSARLKRAETLSCGCIREILRSLLHRTHGYSRRGAGGTRTPEYQAWLSARARCFNPTDGNYHRYGWRGITICLEWNDFRRFLADVGPCPPKHTLDRIDVNGNYEPGNCRWITKDEQARNRRDNVRIEYQGRVYVMAELARLLGIDDKLFWRMYTVRRLTIDQIIAVAKSPNRRKTIWSFVGDPRKRKRVTN